MLNSYDSIFFFFFPNEHHSSHNIGRHNQITPTKLYYYNIIINFTVNRQYMLIASSIRYAAVLLCKTIQIIAVHNNRVGIYCRFLSSIDFSPYVFCFYFISFLFLFLFDSFVSIKCRCFLLFIFRCFSIYH